MSTTQPLPNTPVGIYKVSGPTPGPNDAVAGPLAEILKTREVRQLLMTVVPEFLNAWAGQNWWKKPLSKFVGSMVSNQLSQPEDLFENDEITALFENEEFIKKVNEQLPGAINGVVDVLTAGTGSIENMSVEDKKQMFQDLLSKTGKGRTGKVLTGRAKILNDIHDADDQFFAKAMQPAFEKWLESIDLGEIKEMFDKSGTDGRALVEMVMTTLFEYPTKFVVLLTYLPGLGNFIADSLKIVVSKVNLLPPDMLTDVLLSVAKDINGTSVSNLINQLTEVVRKVSTGSELIGEPGSPRLPKDLGIMMEGIISDIDPVVLWKAKVALAEIKAAFGKATADAVNENPEYQKLNMVRGPELSNIRTKAFNHKISSWDAMDDEETSELWSANLNAHDVQETAEAVNNVLRLINRLAEEKPAMFGQFIGQFASAIDDYELAESVKNVFNGAGDEIRPAARAVVPGLVTWICDVLQPEDDEYEDEAAQAREAIQSLFAAEEVY